jgi:hypothetical protein
MEEKGYKEHLLREERGMEDASGIEKRNSIRRLLRDSFASITFHFFPALDARHTRARALAYATLPATFPEAVNALAAQMAAQLKETPGEGYFEAMPGKRALSGVQKAAILEDGLKQIQASKVIKVDDLTTAMYRALCEAAVEKMQQEGEAQTAAFERAALMKPCELDAFIARAEGAMRAVWAREAPPDMLPSLVTHFEEKVSSVLGDYANALRGRQNERTKAFGDGLYGQAAVALRTELEQAFREDLLPLEEERFLAIGDEVFDKLWSRFVDSVQDVLSDGHVAGYETALRAEYNGLLAVHEANNDRVRVTNELKAAQARNDTTKEELQKMKAKVGRTGDWASPCIESR